MKILHGRGPALDSTHNTAARSRLLRRVSAILSGLVVGTMATMVAAPALILSANSRVGQATAPASKPAGAPAGNAENGKQLFKKYGCYECHGSRGQIASRAGPALAPDLVPFEGFAPYVRHPAGSMPPYTEKVVSDQDLADIYAFLQSTPHPPAAKTIPILN
jgi:mono/diheme cytochrome c family protein